MPTDVTVLSAQVGFDFRSDELRLTLLTTDPVLQALKEVFHFKQMSVDTPPPVFGDVPLTMPPGLVCQSGDWAADGRIVPVRAMHIEPRRIVVDVADHSDFALRFFAELRALINQFESQTSAAIGEPQRTVFSSEISSRLGLDESLFGDSPLEHLFSIDPSLRDTARGIHWGAYFWPVGAEFSGPAQSKVVVIEPRAGSNVGDRLYYSAAPLSSERHLEWLSQLESM